MAKIVESVLGWNVLMVFWDNPNFKTIVTTCKDDYDYICKELIDNRNLSISVTNVDRPLSYFKSPLSKSQLQSLGFSDYILDVIQGPEEVLSFLCQRAAIHSTVRILT